MVPCRGPCGHGQHRLGLWQESKVVPQQRLLLLVAGAAADGIDYLSSKEDQAQGLRMSEQRLINFFFFY